MKYVLTATSSHHTNFLLNSLKTNKVGAIFVLDNVS